MILTELTVDTREFEARTGWMIEPEGACRAGTCVPLPDTARLDGGRRLDPRVVAECLGMPLVPDEAHGLWALGPSTAGGGHALATAVAPDAELPDGNGRPFRLSSLRGQKVLLLAWASW